MKDQYGITGISTPRHEFFVELTKPIDQKLVEKAKTIFAGIENVKVIKG